MRCWSKAIPTWGPFHAYGGYWNVRSRHDRQRQERCLRASSIQLAHSIFRRYFKENQPRGEFTIVVEGFNQEKQGLEESNEPLSTADICDLVQALVQEGVDKKTAIKKIAVKLNLSRRDVYQTMLEAEKKEEQL